MTGKPITGVAAVALATDVKTLGVGVGVGVATGVVTGAVVCTTAVIVLYSPWVRMVGLAEILKYIVLGLMLSVESQPIIALIMIQNINKRFENLFNMLFLQI